MAVVKPMGPFWSVGEFATHFRLPILVVGFGPVHWGYGLLILTHGHIDPPRRLQNPKLPVWLRAVELESESS